MTGVGGRPEVIVEGSDDPDDGWKEYHFLYKPGDVKYRLPFVGELLNSDFFVLRLHPSEYFGVYPLLLQYIRVYDLKAK